MRQPDGHAATPAEKSVSLEVGITGCVQGVGFRYFASEVAQDLGLVGYVMNLRDGAVRAYAEGRREALEHFLSALRKGPAGALVREVRPVWGTATGQYSTFTIQPTR